MTFKIFGVVFEISYLFACSVLLCIACDRTNSFLPMLLSIACHELGHIVMLSLFGCKIMKFKMIAGMVGIEFEGHLAGAKNIAALLAGPVVNLILSVMGLLFGNDVWFLINVILAVYNLLPIKGLDGYDVFEETVGSVIGQRVFLIITYCFSVIFLLCLAAFFIISVPKYGINYSVFLVLAYVILQFALKK